MSLATQIALVVAGSACGGLARWVVGLATAQFFPSVFPWATFAVNIVGSFILGWLLTAITAPAEHLWGGLSPEAWRLAIGVGFCGAFTTFSTFEHDANQLFTQGESWLAVLYVGGSFTLGLLALRAGVWVAR